MVKNINKGSIFFICSGHGHLPLFGSCLYFIKNCSELFVHDTALELEEYRI